MGQTNDSSLPGLLATCVLMFVGAYGCGMLPSWLPISEQRLASVSAGLAEPATRMPVALPCAVPVNTLLRKTSSLVLPNG
jgi:hypothetical protein